MRSHLIFVLAAGTALASCSSAPTPNPNLDAAATLYNQASNDPLVVKDAPLELQQSRDALAQAQNLWEKKADRTEVDHYAYLAGRYAEGAQQTAKLKEAQSRAANTAATRQQLAATTAEAAQARQQTTELQRQTEQLQQQLATLRADNQNTGMVLRLGNNILFDVNGTTIKPGAYDSIRQIAAYLKQHPERTVSVEGFTDSTGNAEHNLQLSQLRAEAVRNALVHEGIAPDRIIAQGLGDSAPVASNDNPTGRQLNRRVDVAISDRSGHMPAGASSLSGTTQPSR